MKKLLTILGTVSLTATAASNVISCSCGKPTPISEQSTNQQPQIPQTAIQNDINTMVAYELFVNNNTTIDDVKNAVKVDDSHGLFSAIEKTIHKQYVRSENIFVTNNIYNTNDEYDFTLLEDKDVRESKNVYVEIRILKGIKVRIRVELIFDLK